MKLRVALALIAGLIIAGLIARRWRGDAVRYVFPASGRTPSRAQHCHDIAEITGNLVDMRDGGMSIEAVKAMVSRSLHGNPSTIESTDNYVDMIYANPKIPKSQFVSEVTEACLQAK
jgi:hypothetical protein